ncbi:hypothetical protein BU14_0307s0003 [Porphyra umbilicalis]|uniref:Uncharacterized protein n=1 Tax=Porphyra umbilicalis TaxID=2786 RepID=A0A1X6P005_PORUM|nr:hypothetical protein BU14_0307s0003 [Porphyra umbilicalis]|eukprot:OSX74100.1 hypothetical protein BU14_0307s0003 [Porphyra umbilicalis]
MRLFLWCMLQHPRFAPVDQRKGPPVTAHRALALMPVARRAPPYPCRSVPPLTRRIGMAAAVRAVEGDERLAGGVGRPAAGAHATLHGEHRPYSGGKAAAAAAPPLARSTPASGAPTAGRPTAGAPPPKRSSSPHRPARRVSHARRHTRHATRPRRASVPRPAATLRHRPHPRRRRHTHRSIGAAGGGQSRRAQANTLGSIHSVSGRALPRCGMVHVTPPCAAAPSMANTFPSSPTDGGWLKCTPCGASRVPTHMCHSIDSRAQRQRRPARSSRRTTAVSPPSKSRRHSR